jgi:hypothetical protein
MWFSLWGVIRFSSFRGDRKPTLRWADLISPLKSSHFEKASILLARFLVCCEWSSDCWCIWKSFRVNACLHWRNVFSFHWRSVFVQFFYEFFEFIFDCTCALAHQSQCAGIVYEHYCLCPRPTPAGSRQVAILIRDYPNGGWGSVSLSLPTIRPSLST